MPGRVERVDERPEVVRRAERGLGREVAAHLVAPRRRVRMLHHRHQLHVGEAEVGDIRHELGGEIAPREALPPGAGMNLVDRRVARHRVGSAPPREPFAVRPGKPALVDDRCVLGRHLGEDGVRVGLEPRDPVGARNRRACTAGLRARSRRLPPRSPTTRPASAGRPPRSSSSSHRRPRRRARSAPRPRTARRRLPHSGHRGVRRGARGGPRRPGRGRSRRDRSWRCRSCRAAGTAELPELPARRQSRAPGRPRA